MDLSLFKKSEHKMIENHDLTESVFYPETLEKLISKELCLSAVNEIKQWPSYQETPLCELSKLSEKLNLASIFYKDESSRFGLGSFKSLGGAYALLCLLKEELSKRKGFEVSEEEIRKGLYREDCQKITAVTATDGNHGKSVAWGAQLFGCQCRIYMHAEVSQGRQDAVEEFGATVVRIQGNYDESVVAAKKDAFENNWFIVSDTSDESYLKIPAQVMGGYTVLVDEAFEQMKGKMPTHIFLQAGVGGLAAAVCARLWQFEKEHFPKVIIVEPELADCLYQSGSHHEAKVVDVEEESLMAGLSCGKVSYLAWEVLSQKAGFFMKISDKLVAPCMKGLAYSEYGEESIEAGESAVAGLAALMEASLNEEKREALGLNQESRVLLIGTEGATDPEIYQRLVN